MSVSDVVAERRVPLATVVLGLWLAVAAWFVIVGSDLMWVVALGDVVRSGGGVPTSLPFASAPQAEWHNPIALAEVLFSGVHGLGPAGLASFQLLLVAATLVVVLAEGRRLGGGEGRGALVVSGVVIGASVHLVIARLPSLSLVPFVVALAVLRHQHDRPSRAVWWLVPLYVVWGNLHGGVLVGLAVLGVFLVASPGGGPLLRRVGVGAGCALALVVTSAGIHTPAYYISALGNEAAARGTDLWARPSLTHPLDVAMIAAALVLAVLAVRGRPPLWEWLAAAGLVLGTASAGRHGIWLLLFLAPAAMRARGPVRAALAPGAARVVAMVTLVAVAGSAAAAFTVRGSAVGPPGSEVVDVVRDAAQGRPVLASEPLAETLAQAGVTVWAANPIDAFPREVQGSFLDFLHDGTVPDDPAIGLVVVAEEAAPAVEGGGGWVASRAVDGYVLLTPAQ